MRELLLFFAHPELLRPGVAHAVTAERRDGLALARIRFIDQQEITCNGGMIRLAFSE